MRKFELLYRVEPGIQWPKAADLEQHALLGRMFMPAVEAGLPEDGFIPEKDAVLAWDVVSLPKSVLLVANFTVFYRPLSVFDDEHVRDRWSICAGMSSMTGAVNAGWTEYPTGNAAAIYGDVVVDGFVDRGEGIRALGEVAKIRECVWAREQLGAVARKILGQPPEDTPECPPYWLPRDRREVEELTDRLIPWFGPVNEADVRRQLDEAILTILRQRAVRVGEEDHFPECMD
jgi:hypothetical protein